MNAIGLKREEVSPEILRMQFLSASEKTERRGVVAKGDAEAMDFLRFLLTRKPDVNYRNPTAVPSESPATTALETARLWKLTDVVTLLKKAGARR